MSKLPKLVLASEKRRFNVYLDRMRAMFKEEEF